MLCMDPDWTKDRCYIGIHIMTLYEIRCGSDHKLIYLDYTQQQQQQPTNHSL